MPPESVAQGVAAVRERIEKACAGSGRRPGDVRLIAVGKTQPATLIGEAIEAGVTAFGENYVQEAEAKIRAYPGVEWHLIGKLQGNKARKAVSLFSWIQSADSVRILAEISRRSVEAGKAMPVLVEVNLAGEASKAGVSPESLPEIIDEASGMPGVRLLGLMTIPPPAPSPEESRPWFARLRRLLETGAGRGGAGQGMRELSMGMSHDFDVAIEEGATMVRVGTAIFGSRARRRG